MLDNKDTIIFDFDGTLVDTMHIFADVASHLISENYNISQEEARNKYLKTSGLPFVRQLENIFPNHKLNNKIVRLYESQKLNATADVVLEKEVGDALSFFKKYDLNLVISSNNYQYNLDNFIINNNLSNIFSLVLGYKDNFSKGFDHFNEVIKQLAIEKESAVFIGDSLHDAVIAKDFGIDFIGITGTFNKKDFLKIDKDMKIINNISDLVL